MIRFVVTGMLVTTAAAQSYPPAFPRTNATKLLETDRIVVWDIVWPKGEPTPLHRHVHDQVGTYYQAGGRVITNPDGTKREATTPVGALSRTRKGTMHIEEGATDPPLRAVFIELKSDAPSGLPEIPQGVPSMFPRAGARELMDDERVSVWDYTWRPGETIAAARHGRDTVWIWLEPGTLGIRSPGQQEERLTVSSGQIRYVPRGTVSEERVLAGAPRAMIFAFK
jgi:hypothetical protein